LYAYLPNAFLKITFFEAQANQMSM
jgi:hypothetical protein